MVPMKAKIIVIILHKFNIYNDSENLQKKKIIYIRKRIIQLQINLQLQ